ncbi:MAG: hypothetical protein Aurels2KO_10250 [Aureliella sp.]
MNLKQIIAPVDKLPRSVAVIGAAGGLGQGILKACRDKGVHFTAIVRSRPERIQDIPEGSRVEVVSSLADTLALTGAFIGAEVVFIATGVTSTSQDESALLSRNMCTVKQAMQKSGVRRIVLMNTLLSQPPGAEPGLLMRLFSWFPGKVGRGARELQAVVSAVGEGQLSPLEWTLVRGAVNSKGADEAPIASLDWSSGLNSWMPVSYFEMGKWILQDASKRKFIHQSPLVSRRK